MDPSTVVTVSGTNTSVNFEQSVHQPKTILQQPWKILGLHHTNSTWNDLRSDDQDNSFDRIPYMHPKNSGRDSRPDSPVTVNGLGG
jgi:hypothetical protein